MTVLAGIVGITGWSMPAQVLGLIAAQTVFAYVAVLARRRGGVVALGVTLVSCGLIAAGLSLLLAQDSSLLLLDQDGLRLGVGGALVASGLAGLFVRPRGAVILAR